MLGITFATCGLNSGIQSMGTAFHSTVEELEMVKHFNCWRHQFPAMITVSNISSPPYSLPHRVICIKWWEKSTTTEVIGMQRGQTLKPLTKTRGNGLGRKNWPWSRSTGHINCHVLGEAAKFIVQGRKALQLLQACAVSSKCTQTAQKSWDELINYAVRIAHLKEINLKKGREHVIPPQFLVVVWTSCCKISLHKAPWLFCAPFENVKIFEFKIYRKHRQELFLYTCSPKSTPWAVKLVQKKTCLHHTSWDS